VISHWDEAETDHAELGHISASWTSLAAATNARNIGRIGVNRIQVDPGRWSTPAHIEAAEEEVFYVLGGSGWSWQQLGAEGEVRMHAVRVGDCIVHLAGRERHTFKAGDDGLDLVAFGNRHATIGFAYLPRAKVGWIGGTWVDAGGGDWPWQREVDVGPPEEVEPTERPENIRREDDVEPHWDGKVYFIAEAAGSTQSGLNLTRLPPGEEGAPPHVHSMEDEFFVVLEGSGRYDLEPTPARMEFGGEPETHEVRRGTVISKPAGGGMCHLMTAGPEGLTYLVYGTRHPNDVVYYPRKNGLWFKSAGVMIAADHIPLLDE
jgi:uncharacterized cupin superfamily protein